MHAFVIKRPRRTYNRTYFILLAFILFFCNEILLTHWFRDPCPSETPPLVSSNEEKSTTNTHTTPCNDKVSTFTWIWNKIPSLQFPFHYFRPVIENVLPPNFAMDKIQLLVQKHKQIQNETSSNLIFIQYLDKSYITLTKSWICNVITFPTVLRRTIFIATDQEAFDGIMEFSHSHLEPRFNVGLEVIYVPHVPPTQSTDDDDDNASHGLSYGTRPYYGLMWYRTAINYMLIKNGIDVFIVESDAVWMVDPSDFIAKQVGDIITMNDKNVGRSRGITHGFSLWRAHKPRMLEFMAYLLQKQHNIVNLGVFQIGERGNEQYHIMNLLRSRFRDIHITFLPDYLFFNGRRFEERVDGVFHPMIRHNNYVVGNDAKIARAKNVGYWFLSDDGNSCNQTIHDVLNRI